MKSSNLALYRQLEGALADVDMQIKHIKNDIAQEYPAEQRPKINVWFWMRYRDGKYVLADLLVARANLLSAMAGLKTAP